MQEIQREETLEERAERLGIQPAILRIRERHTEEYEEMLRFSESLPVFTTFGEKYVARRCERVYLDTGRRCRNLIEWYRRDDAKYCSPRCKAAARDQRRRDRLRREAWEQKQAAEAEARQS